MSIKEMNNNEFHRFIAKRSLATKQSMSFLNEQHNDVSDWKKQARDYIFDRTLYKPGSTCFTERTVEEADFGDYIRKEIYFSNNGEYEIPAYLLIPKHVKYPCPGAVVLHDHGAMYYWGKEKSVEHKDPHPVLKHHFDEYYAGRPLASEMVKRGYVVIVIDCLSFGERRYLLEKNPHYAEKLKKFPFESDEYIYKYNSAEPEAEWEFIRLMENAGLTSMGIRIADDMASVDYLLQMPEVDPDRICCIGLSMGGFRTGWLSAMHDKISCSVLVGYMLLISDMMKNRPGNFAPMWTIPGLYGKMDFPDIVSMAVPKPLMIMHGLRDELFTHTEEDGTITKSGEKAIEKVANVYKKAGFKENLDIKIYDLPHVFNIDMQETAFKWLELKLSDN